MTKNISYRLQFIDNGRFMGRSLWNPLNNFSERIHKIKCKYGLDDKKCETCGIKYKYCDFLLEYTKFKDDLIEYKCLCCNENYKENFDENLRKQFFHTYIFSNHDNNKFILLLRKSVGKFQWKVITWKKDFYSKIVSNLGIYYTWKNIKESCKNNKFKIRAPTWNEIFELLEGSYLVSDIQNCFEYILKKHGEKTDTPSIKKYINKIENRIAFKIKAGYYLIQL